MQHLLELWAELFMESMTFPCPRGIPILNDSTGSTFTLGKATQFWEKDPILMFFPYFLLSMTSKKLFLVFNMAKTVPDRLLLLRAFTSDSWLVILIVLAALSFWLIIIKILDKLNYDTGYHFQL